MIAVGVVVLMALAALACWREGLFTAVTRFVNVLVAGLVAFGLAGPVADLLAPPWAGTPLAGYEDGLCLMALFALTLAALRLATHLLAPEELEYPPALQRGGAAVFGLAAGYLAAGFLLCTLATLPWPEHVVFLDDHAVARALLPDRAWGALLPVASVPHASPTH